MTENKGKRKEIQKETRKQKGITKNNLYSLMQIKVTASEAIVKLYMLYLLQFLQCPRCWHYYDGVHFPGEKTEAYQKQKIPKCIQELVNLNPGSLTVEFRLQKLYHPARTKGGCKYLFVYICSYINIFRIEWVINK